VKVFVALAFWLLLLGMIFDAPELNKAALVCLLIEWVNAHGPE